MAACHFIRFLADNCQFFQLIGARGLGSRQRGFLEE
jgi:hypothetical protein